MTYEEYIVHCQARQREYIALEKVRMANARRAFDFYVGAMACLQLHPMTRAEIEDRQRELGVMLTTIEETHGDSPAMRSAYEHHAKGCTP